MVNLASDFLAVCFQVAIDARRALAGKDTA